MEGDGELVQLRVYDLSQGLARQLSPMLLGRQIEAIYHTSIVVGGVEHFYGGGIQESIPGHTPYGQPIQILDLGRTHLPAEVRQDYLVDISDRYSPQNYHLFNHNCNNFSDEFATFLTGTGIPSHITSLPAEVLSTPFGQAIAPMLGGIEARLNTPAAQQHAITRSHPQPEELLDMAPGPPPTASVPSPAAASAAAVVHTGASAAAPAATECPAAASSPTAACATAPAHNVSAAAVSSPAAASATGAASAEPAAAAVSSPPASAPEPADTDTPSAAAMPELPPAPQKGAAADTPSRRAASVSPCVTEAAAGLSLGSPGDQVAPRKVSRTSGGSSSGQPKRPLRFDASDQDEQAQQAQPSSQAPSAAAKAAAAARATASASGAAPQPLSSASAPADLQAAFQAALTQEFMRIRAMHPTVSPNEAAALALKTLREKSPGLVAARG